MSSQADHTCFHTNDEMVKHVRSANMSKKEVRGRKTRILPAMDAEERFHQKRLGYIKCCIDTKHNIPLSSISMKK